MDASIDQDIRRSFLTTLAATPAGRQHLLSISVDAEEGDEGGLFDQLVDVVDDPKLRRVVERHRDDEVRHAQLFRDCLARTGLTKQPVPDDLLIIRQIAETADENDREVRTPEDIVATYALLFAIEERGVEQFPVFAEAFRPVDPETADTYLRVARDERGHVRYCEQIGRHYAADDRAWHGALATARAREETAFAAVGTANFLYCASQGWLSDEAEREI
jgi:rubrerythrin